MSKVWKRIQHIDCNAAVELHFSLDGLHVSLRLKGTPGNEMELAKLFYTWFDLSDFIKIEKRLYNMPYQARYRDLVAKVDIEFNRSYMSVKLNGGMHREEYRWGEWIMGIVDAGMPSVASEQVLLLREYKHVSQVWGEDFVITEATAPPDFDALHKSMLNLHQTTSSIVELEEKRAEQRAREAEQLLEITRQKEERERREQLAEAYRLQEIEETKRKEADELYGIKPVAENALAIVQRKQKKHKDAKVRWGDLARGLKNGVKETLKDIAARTIAEMNRP